MRGRNTLWVLGTDHAGIGTQAVVEKELARRRASRATSSAARRSSSGSGSGASEYGRRDRRAVQAARRVVRLRARAVHARRGLRARRLPGLRRPLREGADLPRQLHRQLGSRARARRSPTSRSRTARSPTRSTRSTTRSRASDEVLTVATVRPETMLADTAVAVHPDDERYRHLVGGHCTLPLVGTAAADHRRRARRSRVRHRGAEDHARPRPERLRDRPRPRASRRSS